MRILSLIISGLIIISCSSEKKDDQGKVSLWDKWQEDEFIKLNSLTDFDNFFYGEIITNYKYEITYQRMVDTLKNKDFQNSIENKKSQFFKKYTVDISKIAGKSKNEVKNILGSPNKEEKVNPSRAPCPCDQLNYLNNLVEIVYMNGAADWITVNNSTNYVDFGNRSNYQSTDQFEDYTYVKVKTR